MPQPLNTRKPQHSNLGLFFLCSLSTFILPVSWLHILSLCCWLQICHSSPHLSHTLYLTFPLRQRLLEMPQTQPSDLFLLHLYCLDKCHLSLPSGHGSEVIWFLSLWETLGWTHQEMLWLYPLSLLPSFPGTQHLLAEFCSTHLNTASSLAPSITQNFSGFPSHLE